MFGMNKKLEDHKGYRKMGCVSFLNRKKKAIEKCHKKEK